MPDVGIPDAWTTFLGFPSEPRPVDSFYRLCHVGSCSLQDAAECVLDRVKSLGQHTVQMVGDADTPVSRMAVGTGAITRLPEMFELGPDLLLVTDDGISSTASGLWSLDLGVPMLIVNHATAELPGMMAMVGYRFRP